MRKGFYWRMAAQNLWHNRRMYLPYAIAAAIMTAISFIIMNLIFSRSIGNMSYGDTTMAVLAVGMWVMAFFLVGYMLYINSFLIKRRKKEFGLYAVLGLEKRHVAAIIRRESVLLDGASLLFGLISGAVLGKLAMLLLLKAVRVAPDSRYEISPRALLLTVALFAAIFVLSTAYNELQVRLANPAQLLIGEKKREKPLRFAPLWAILGLLFLGCAYATAIAVNNPGLAVLLFWPAVILVIIATWLLFTAGSAMLLSRLRKNEKIYYRPRSFIAIGQLAHRMKQNAAGLANICILSTMVLVTLSGCCALYFGQEQILSAQYPDDFRITVSDGAPTKPFIQALDPLAKEAGVAISSEARFRRLSLSALVQGGEIVIHAALNGRAIDYNEADAPLYTSVSILPLSEYRRLTGENLALAGDEILLLSERTGLGQKAFVTASGSYPIARGISGTAFTVGKNGRHMEDVYLVAGDEDKALQLAREIGSNASNDPDDPAELGKLIFSEELRINIAGEEKNCLLFAESLREALPRYFNGYGVGDIYTSRDSSYSLFGGLILMGAMFSLLFLTNTVLLIYFKQISEGFDDRARFEILQKLGMSDAEVRRTANEQIRIMFFLPLFGALVNVFASGHMLGKIMQAFALYDMGLTFLCIALISLLFALSYAVFYRLTAGTYYRLVKS